MEEKKKRRRLRIDKFLEIGMIAFLVLMGTLIIMLIFNFGESKFGMIAFLVTSVVLVIKVARSKV